MQVVCGKCKCYKSKASARAARVMQVVCGKCKCYKSKASARAARVIQVVCGKCKGYKSKASARALNAAVNEGVSRPRAVAFGARATVRANISCTVIGSMTASGLPPTARSFTGLSIFVV